MFMQSNALMIMYKVPLYDVVDCFEEGWTQTHVTLLTRHLSSCTLRGSGSDAGGSCTLSQFSLLSTACSHCSYKL